VKKISITRYARNIEEKNILNEKNVGHTIISYIINVFAIFIMGYVGIKYINDPDPLSSAYASYALMLMIFGLIGFLSIDYFDNGEINFIPKSWKEFNTMYFIIAVTVLLILSTLIDYVLKTTIRFALSDTDMFLYYVFAGVCEEAFYRAFLINLIIRLFTNMGKRPNIIVILFAILVSSVIFMLSHLSVYGTNPAMLLSTFVGGLVLGGFYVVFRDIGANMVSHAVKNALGYANKVR